MCIKYLVSLAAAAVTIVWGCLRIIVPSKHGATDSNSEVLPC